MRGDEMSCEDIFFNDDDIQKYYHGEIKSNPELQKGMSKIKVLKQDQHGNYVIRELGTNKVLEISYAGYTLKRGSGKKKLRADNKYLKEQVAVLHSTLLKIMMMKSENPMFAKDIDDIFYWTQTALDEYSTNEFNRRCELDPE